VFSIEDAAQKFRDGRIASAVTWAATARAKAALNSFIAMGLY